MSEKRIGVFNGDSMTVEEAQRFASDLNIQLGVGGRVTGAPMHNESLGHSAPRKPKTVIVYPKGSHHDGIDDAV